MNDLTVFVVGGTCSGKSAVSQVINEVLKERGVAGEWEDVNVLYGPEHGLREKETLDKIFKNLRTLPTKVQIVQVQVCRDGTFYIDEKTKGKNQ